MVYLLPDSLSNIATRIYTEQGSKEQGLLIFRGPKLQATLKKTRSFADAEDRASHHKYTKHPVKRHVQDIFWNFTYLTLSDQWF